jgi:hypothetical protein
VAWVYWYEPVEVEEGVVAMAGSLDSFPDGLSQVSSPGAREVPGAMLSPGCDNRQEGTRSL